LKKTAEAIGRGLELKAALEGIRMGDSEGRVLVWWSGGMCMLVGLRQRSDGESGTDTIQVTHEVFVTNYDKSLLYHLGEEAPEDVKLELTEKCTNSPPERERKGTNADLHI